jgi:hypothetical protein
MSDEIKTDPIPLTPAPSKLAKLKKWWPSIPSAAFLATLVGVLWPHGQAKQADAPPLVVISSGLQTNWSATEVSHDPRLPVTVLTLTNGLLFTNINNVIVRRAEIYRASLVGFKGPDGSIVPVAQAVVIAGSIVQTNGVDSTVLTQLRTNR